MSLLHEPASPLQAPWVHPATVVVFTMFVCGLEVLVLY